MRSVLLTRSFSVYRSHVLSDPIAFEGPLVDVVLTVIADERGKLISTNESGATISQETLQQYLSIAKERSSHLQRPL
jgi:exosome complex RNA-binding protein Rrp42 (RNase PH superfamily)